MAGLTIEPTACLLEEGGLRKGKAIKKRNTSEKYKSVPTCHYFQQKRRSAFESSQTRRPTRPPPSPGHPTPFD